MTGILRAAAAAVAFGLGGCGVVTTIPTNPKNYDIEPKAVAHLRAPQSVALKNGFPQEEKMTMKIEHNFLVVEQRKLTDTAIAMLGRALQKRGITVSDDAEKTLTLRANARGYVMQLFRWTGQVLLETRLGDGPVVSNPSENLSGKGFEHAFDGAVLFALNDLLADERFVAYMNREGAHAQAPVVSTAALAPPARSAPDFKAIAGRWQGTLYYRAGSFPATLTIGDDGRWEHLVPNLSSPGPRFVGTMSIVDGKFRYRSQTTGLTGTVSIREVSGERVLSLDPDDGTSRGEYRAAAR